MHVSDSCILQKSKRLMTPLQFVTGPSVQAVHSNPKYALLTFASNNPTQWSCMGGIMDFN